MLVARHARLKCSRLRRRITASPRHGRTTIRRPALSPLDAGPPTKPPSPSNGSRTHTAWPLMPCLPSAREESRLMSTSASSAASRYSAFSPFLWFRCGIIR
ncbi:hypothetical protein CYLTODRAFT_399762 [Cylindrobasidium torrendii FP15055 ss-10]|uniref:Uncharacterized protein n=1 Tax=Cylindrobasidium torrendii FP15055 ss-10 TaxID=1314674 RepID=A0A0D7B8I5_9AGAR|nr:hypothetical protein CYLTODRAFT_399762 [Cylindrobasidium torrendii FP15055 ss-10]